MINTNASRKVDAVPTLRTEQVGSLFRTKVWAGLRDSVLDRMEGARWREVMLSAMNEFDGTEDHPMERLLDEVVFILGADKVDFLQQLGRRMMISLLEEVDPLLRNTAHPEKFLAYILGRNLLENIGVLDVHLEPVGSDAPERRLYFTTVGLFHASAVFHEAAFQALGEDLGIPLQVKLVDAGEHSGQGTPHQLSWRCTLV